MQEFYFIADRVNAKEIRVEYKRTEDMIADILTKPLQGKQFYNLREQLLNWTDADTTCNMEFAQSNARWRIQGSIGKTIFRPK